MLTVTPNSLQVQVDCWEEKSDFKTVYDDQIAEDHVEVLQVLWSICVAFVGVEL